MQIAHCQSFIVNRKKTKKDLSLKREFVNSKPKKGFSLIELLIVISLFGFTATIITVGYSGFSRRQLLSNAANSLKSNIRFAQSQSLAGVKESNACSPKLNYPTFFPNSDSNLRGWIIEFNLSATNGLNTTYKIKSMCNNTLGNAVNPCTLTVPAIGNYECANLYKTITLPDNVVIKNVDGAASTSVSKYILFEPLKSEPTFFTNASAITAFYTSGSVSADPRNPVFSITPCCATSGISFGLAEKSDLATTVTVSVTAAGGVTVSKP